MAEPDGAIVATVPPALGVVNVVAATYRTKIQNSPQRVDGKVKVRADPTTIGTLPTGNTPLANGVLN